MSFPVPEPPSSVNPFESDFAPETSIVTAASAFAVNVAFPAPVDLFVVTFVAVKPAIPVAANVAPASITTTSSSSPPAPPRSKTVSVPTSTVIISFPAPPVIMSLPAPPAIVSTSPPPVIVSTWAPPVIISAPAPPIIAKASVWFAKVTSEPEECVFTVSTFCSLLLSAKVWAPVDN